MEELVILILTLTSHTPCLSRSVYWFMGGICVLGGVGEF